MTNVIGEPIRIGSPVLGFIIPAIIFGLSFVVTYLLIRHFMKKQDSE